MKIARFAVLLFFLSATSVWAQTVGPSATPVTQPSDKDTDFRPLFEERENLIEQIKNDEQTIDELSARARLLPPAETLARSLNQAKSDLEKEKKASRPNQERIDTIQRYIDSTAEELQGVKDNGPKLQEAKSDLGKKRRTEFNVEQKIASLFDTSKDVTRFRASATYTFAVLVFLVVSGFYLIAWYKQGVAATIFAGEMGMQFITLFLIVIAIILFGIMGTLEGKELAALLGGLSGYILGRVERKSPDDIKAVLTSLQPTGRSQG